MRRSAYAKLNHKKQKISAFGVVITVLLVLYVLFMLVMLLWAFMTSFKGRSEYYSNPYKFPQNWVIDNYVRALRDFTLEAEIPGLGRGNVTVPLMFLFGFLYAVGCAAAATIVPFVVGYVCAKYPYKFSKVIFYVVIICMILPLIGNLPAEISTVKAFGLYGHIWGTWILKANFLGLYFIIFYNYFKGLPNAYSEAAKIDGAGNFKIMLKVIMPMAIPIFCTVLLLNFITFWNDYQTPFIYLSGKFPTVSLGMYFIATAKKEGFTDAGFKFASSFMVLIPVLILFLAFNKRLLGNLTMGGIKG